MWHLGTWASVALMISELFSNLNNSMPQGWCQVVLYLSFCICTQGSRCLSRSSRACARWQLFHGPEFHIPGGSQSCQPGLASSTPAKLGQT